MRRGCTTVLATRLDFDLQIGIFPGKPNFSLGTVTERESVGSLGDEIEPSLFATLIKSFEFNYIHLDAIAERSQNGSKLAFRPSINADAT
jgi:hypothetical protein